MERWRHGFEGGDKVEPAPIARPELLPKEDVKRLGYKKQRPAALQHSSGPKALDNLLKAGPADRWINFVNQLRDVGSLI